jgi:phosphoribosylamine---glycine ligase
MKILLVGSGGREHAIAWMLSRSPLVERLFAAPGNAGCRKVAEIVNLHANDIPGLLDFAKTESIDLVVVGPEDPLVKGIADELRKRGSAVFGPGRKGAGLEGSKACAKEFMKRHGIPTSDFVVARSLEEARHIIAQHSWARVVKADGLALGKGVVVTSSMEEALDAAEVLSQRFGFPLIIEEKLGGPEISLLSFVDGRTIMPMASAGDYKRAFDDDLGPNTGGMGAISPSPAMTDELLARAREEILLPALRGMEKEEMDYRGVLYAGLMLTPQGLKVLEFNCRFGDPETQVILPRLENDLAEIMLHCAQGTLDGAKHRLSWSESKAVCVVMASGGYPGAYEKGKIISGLEDLEGQQDLMVFHAGTAENNGDIVTSGGRVLSVMALGKSYAEAREKAYGGVKEISFEGAMYRGDIALFEEKAV